MRIIAGKYRGRQIYDPELKETRVSKERLREGLFSALHFDLSGRHVLDLFAGSGILSFEALSRGAKGATLVEINPTCILSLKKSIRALELNADAIKVVNKDYAEAITELSGPFDLVFLDPPYVQYPLDEIIVALLKKDLLSNDNIVVVESNYQYTPDTFAFQRIKHYQYGYSHVTILYGVKNL